ncbi:hypothetical protein F4780DRAFT_784445 [Xylariomycetidae sp. FL0641]|nr:hypothetical protein F4780DRAFT_784445 [Xylariomycetidae sp. FL0641]
MANSGFVGKVLDDSGTQNYVQGEELSSLLQYSSLLDMLASTSTQRLDNTNNSSNHVDHPENWSMASHPSPDALSATSSRPINLKAYEVLANHFEETQRKLGLPFPIPGLEGGQRTSQHDRFIQFYFEHYRQRVPSIRSESANANGD